MMVSVPAWMHYSLSSPTNASTLFQPQRRGAMAAVEPAGDLLEAQALVYHQTFGIIKSMALRCAVDLGIPDIIHGHSRPIKFSDLAAELRLDGEKGDALRRLMRLLVHMGCFSRGGGGHGEEDTYGLTALSTLLLKGNSNNSLHFLNAALSPVALSVWNFFSAWFEGDQPTPLQMAFGKSFWDAAAEDPAFNESVNGTMVGDSRLVVDVVVRECGNIFEGLRSLVDVGGGTGPMAKAIAAAFPGLKCTVLDLPHVVAAAEAAADVEFVGGDMFAHIPQANAVLLKCVLHDWKDDDCVKILKRCKEAIPPKERGGKVIVIDIVVNSCTDDPKLTELQYFFDITMMVTAGGKERDELEWRKIFMAAGFTDYKIKHGLGLRSLIEVYP